MSDAEIEIKLSASTPAAYDAAEAAVNGAPCRPLTSTYYDTPGRKLKHAGYTLRIRRDGERWIQTVKGGAGVRRYEREVRLETPEIDRKQLKATPLAPLLRRCDVLEPVFTTLVSRRSLTREEPSARIELSLDEGEIVSTTQSRPILELELELKSGDLSALFAAAGRLVAESPLRPDFVSKSDRGYALSSGTFGEPFASVPPKILPTDTAGDAFKKAVWAALRPLGANVALIAAERSPGGVHQARVSLRRLRVVLLVFETLLVSEEVLRFKSELVWLTRELEDARGLDVFIGETAGRPAFPGFEEREALAAVGEALLQARSLAYDRAAAAALSPRVAVLLLELARWVEGEPWRGEVQREARAAEPAGGFAVSALKRRLKAFSKKVRRLDWTAAASCHGVRIEAKRMRYAADLFDSLVPERAARRRRRFLHRLKGVQDAFGELNDIHTAAQTAALADWRSGEATRAAATAYGAGLMLGGLAEGLAAAAVSARRSLKRFRAVRPFWRGA